MSRWLPCVLGLSWTLSCGAHDAAPPSIARAQQSHSGPLAISPDHSRLYVAHPDADSVSIVTLATRHIEREILLGASTPTLSEKGRYEPAVGPRALALDSAGATLYVTGQRSGHVYAVDTASGAITADAAVCSEPIGVLVSADDASVFVACSQDDDVLELTASGLVPVRGVACSRKPWGLAWSGQTLLATHLLGGSPGGPPPSSPGTGPAISVLSTAPLTLETTWSLDDGPPRATDGTLSTSADEDPTEPHGQVRGVYDAMVRPGSSELWVAHLMLGTDKPQAALDFQDTVFPAISILDARGGAELARLSVSANPGDGGAFGDIVSGPRAITFSDDGKLAFVVDADSEDVLVVDAARRIETQIVRPLPGHLPDGIVFAGGEIFVEERNTEDVAAFLVTASDAGLSVTPDGAAFPTLAADPMPASLRLGQRLFYSANSDEYPLTQNHWVACATCHLEGRSDAVTWKFVDGPRDVPSNAGGLLDTGFLFHTADRRRVQDYWRTIDEEQGGDFDVDRPTQAPLLDALAAYVNFAIPTPVPPSTDATHSIEGGPLAALRAQGEGLFASLGCVSCHAGEAKTDSGKGNPTLDLQGKTVSTAAPGGVLLHDVGTCETTGDFPDVAHVDMDGDARGACAFDTPALRGLSDSAPYFHDGSAATLDQVVPIMVKAAAAASGRTGPTLSAGDARALVEYLRSL